LLDHALVTLVEECRADNSRTEIADVARRRWPPRGRSYGRRRPLTAVRRLPRRAPRTSSDLPAGSRASTRSALAAICKRPSWRGGFEARLESGATILAEKIIATPGVAAFANVPPEMKRSLPHDTPRFEKSDWSCLDDYLDATLRTRGRFRRLPPQCRKAVNVRVFLESRHRLEPWLAARIAKHSIKQWPRRKVVEYRELGLFRAIRPWRADLCDDRAWQRVRGRLRRPLLEPKRQLQPDTAPVADSSGASLLHHVTGRTAHVEGKPLFRRYVGSPRPTGPSWPERRRQHRRHDRTRKGWNSVHSRQRAQLPKGDRPRTRRLTPRRRWLQLPRRRLSVPVLRERRLGDHIEPAEGAPSGGHQGFTKRLARSRAS
jgi:hypothetical protein